MRRGELSFTECDSGQQKMSSDKAVNSVTISERGGFKHRF